MNYAEQLEKLAQELECTKTERAGMEKLILAAREHTIAPEEATVTSTRPVERVNFRQIARERQLERIISTGLGSTAILPPGVLGIAQGLTSQVETLADSIIANGEGVVEGLSAYMPPAVQEADVRKQVMEQTRERFLNALIERRYTDALQEFDGEIIEGFMSEITDIPGTEVYNWAAAAAIVVAATLVHSVYTSYASGKLGDIYTNPRWDVFAGEEVIGAKMRRVSRFQWF